MRGPYLNLVVFLMSCVSLAWSQPGPEQQAAPESSAPQVFPDRGGSAPSPSEAIPAADATATSTPDTANLGAASVEDSVTAVAADSVASVTPASMPDSIASATPDSVPASVAPDPSGAARAKAEAARRHQGRPGTFASVPAPEPAASASASVAPAGDTLVPYEDERGGGQRLKSDPKASKLYRSPRKAFFYSLVVPGSGQAWCGAYVRASVFVAAEVGLFYGWYDVSIRQAREKSREARRYADAHWSAYRYENTRKRLYDEVGGDNRSVVDQASPYRDRYCDAIYGYEESVGRTACLERPADSLENYRNHVELLKDSGLGPAMVQEQRDARIKDLAVFYDRIGRDEEFVPGWEDATSGDVTYRTLRSYDSALTDNDPSTVPTSSPWGTSDMRAMYLGLRQDADDLAATQSWFLGGLVLNHLLSAVDAALTAQRWNRRLYKEEKTTWVDGLHVRGGLAWARGPATRADMILDF